MSPRQPAQQQLPTTTTTTTQVNTNTGDHTMLNRLMDMVAALQDQVNNLPQERVIPPQTTTTSTIPIQQEGTLPLLDDDVQIESHFSTPPIDEPAIRDESTQPTITSTTAFERPAYTSNTGHKLKASDFPNFYGKDNEDVDEWIEKVSAIFGYSSILETPMPRFSSSCLESSRTTLLPGSPVSASLCEQVLEHGTSGSIL
jgi:hypothetical protein